MVTIGESLVHLLGSVVNVASDAINSLDMIGLNVSGKVRDGFHTVGDEILDHFQRSSAIGSSNQTNVTRIGGRQDVIWGSFGMVLLFLPGVAFLIANGFAGSIKNTIVGVASFLCFPLALVVVQALAVCGLGQEYLPSLIAVEAVFQCFPQLVLQFFIILYDYPLTPLLLVTIFSSFLVLLKNVIIYDKESVSLKDWQEVLKYSLKIVPIYVTLVIFRVASYSILLAYLRFWAFLPASLLFIELCLLARFYVDYALVDAVIASIMNMGMMNMGKWWRDTDVNLSMKMAWHGDWNLSRDMKFIKWSAIIIYCHLSLTLAVLMMMVNMNPQMMDHWSGLILHPTDCEKFNFNVVCVNVLVCGFVNLLLLRL